MTKEQLEEIIKKEFGLGAVGSPFGSCREKFLNEKMIEIANKNNFPKHIIEILKAHPYRFPKYKKFDNGYGAGFIGLIDSQYVKGEG